MKLTAIPDRIKDLAADANMDRNRKILVELIDNSRKLVDDTDQKKNTEALE